MQRLKKKSKMLSKNGVILLSSVLILSSCSSFGFGKKKPEEPKLTWCSAYEDGSWECLKKDDTFETRLPHEMTGYVSLPIEDAETYRKFCVRRRQ